MMNSNVYVIPESNWEALTAKIEKMGRRADRLGVQTPTITVIHEQVIERSDNGKKVMINHLFVTLSGERPKLNGWSFIGMIDHVDENNIITCVPGEDIPIEYRAAKPICQHCGINRKRNETFICQHESGEHRQVGRTCLADFIGTTNINGMMSWMEWIIQIDGLMRSSEHIDGGYDRMFSIEEIVGYTITVIKEFGWVSKAVANDKGIDSTAKYVDLLLHSDRDNGFMRSEFPDLIKCLKPLSPEDQKERDAAIQWAAQIDPETDNNYLYNLYAVAKNGYVRLKHIGISASLYRAYQRSNGEPRVNIASVQQSIHVGVIGNKYLFKNITVENIGPDIHGPYGISNPVNLQDSRGNVYVWFSSNLPDFIYDSFKDKTIIDIIGTVKGHSELRGVKQTGLTRVAAPTKTNIRKLDIIG